MSLKHKVASYMRKNMEYSFIYDVAVKINLLFFHFEKREHKKRFGSANPEKTFYVVRGCGKEAGLFALYIGVLNEVYECTKKGWIPVVDFTKGRTQYNEDFPVRENIWNAWEYYFQQPQNAYSLEEVYQSKNVILSGWRLRNQKERTQEIIWDSEKITETEEIQKLKNYISEYGRLQLDIEKRITEEKREIFQNRKNVLGVSVRGTDYIAFKPKGHCVQPPLEDVILKVEEFLQKHREIDGIFLTTEDEKIFMKFKNKFGELIFTSNSNRISNYSGDSYITTELRKNSKYEQGLEYLIEKTLLARCEYLVATRTAGADYALVVNGNSYKDKFVFDLGKY